MLARAPQDSAAPNAITVFGPPYAVLNLSKVGIRYFRIFLNVSTASSARLLERFMEHPNIGWIFSAEGWFNLGIGVWAADNSEINDISVAIRNMLSPGDEVVYQSELTSLYGFGNRPAGEPESPMPIVDATHAPVALSPLELDYIKIVTLDDSIELAELARILGIEISAARELRMSLSEREVIVGLQRRLDYRGRYFKVMLDTSSKARDGAPEALWERLWSDPNCLYVARANGKYDFEFEVVLPDDGTIEEYLGEFKEFKTSILTKNLYTNLYPLGKMANLLQIEKVFAAQAGDTIDFRESKLWYLSRKGAEAYLDIYKNRAYAEIMEKSEIDLFADVAIHLKRQFVDKAFSIIDVGSGDGIKSRIFAETLGDDRIKAFYPVDIQPVELATALRAHEEGKYAKLPTLLDFENLSARFPLQLPPTEHAVALFLGGTYGNFEHRRINAYLKPLVAPGTSLFVAMPIRDESVTDEKITETYANIATEGVAFAPLEQIGFRKGQFCRNPQHPDLVIQPRIEDGRNVCQFVLKDTVALRGRVFGAGTVFKMISSWKPTLPEFRAALELDFSVDHMFTNSAIAIASVISKAS